MAPQKIFFLLKRLVLYFLMFVKYSGSFVCKEKVYKYKLHLGQGYIAESFEN